MSTNDVPGARAINNDELHAGCWAEHADGSLVYVKGTEGETVVYEIYDMAHEPPVVYTDAMAKDQFNTQFSYDPKKGKGSEKWTWHDKTPFDWKRVMALVPERPRPGFASVGDMMSAAERVARSLNLRARELQEENIVHRTDSDAEKRGMAILSGIARAIGTLVK